MWNSRKFVVAAHLALLGSFAVSTMVALPAFALTPADVVKSCQTSADRIANLYVHLTWTSKNVGPHNQVLQEFNEAQELWFGRKEKRMRFKKGDDDQLFDHAKRVMRRKVKGDVREVKYDRDIEDATPAVLHYLLYPTNGPCG